MNIHKSKLCEFFDVIDSEEKAYWLGFIYADGSINSRYTTKINVSIKDGEHLNQFASIFKRPVRIYKQYGGYGLSIQSIVCINSMYMYNRLKELGMPERDVTKAFSCIPDCYISDFVRGIFDGDGSVSYNKNYPARIHLSFSIACMDTDYANNLQDVIINFTKGLRKTKIVAGSIRYCGNGNARLFYNWIYNDCEVYLLRKKKVFEDILNHKDLCR